MSAPRLTFLCDLEAADLDKIVTIPVIKQINTLHARLSLGIRDFSPDRAKFVRRLSQEGIPVVAWIKPLPEDGFWFSRDNSFEAISRYRAFRSWSQKNELSWAGVGINFSPDPTDIERLVKDPWPTLPSIIRHLFTYRLTKRAENNYKILVQEIHLDGYKVESYIHPLIIDERKVGSKLIRLVFGMVDVQTDNEIWSLHTSTSRLLGAGLIGSYGIEAPAISIGDTDQFRQSKNKANQYLNWREFSRDLRLAWYYSDDLFIDNLKGCIDQGFLDMLLDFSWDEPILLPDEGTTRVDNLRGLGRTILLLYTRGPLILTCLAAGI